jgi:poly(A) polymerase/tRNA nucleotidyltransferase (CCA-adding enzyme)
MARLPLPGTELSPADPVPGDPGERIPAEVLELVEAFRAGGHAAYLVGGSLRDLMLGRQPADWDLATDARPERIVELFPGAVYENLFGTVAVRHADQIFEITTFRRDHDYADFRRPHRVEFGDTIEVDLARRDFTVNAMAWGGRPGDQPGLRDPHRGLDDLGRRVLRAVGRPEARFGEDALRMVRAVRLSATLGFSIEPKTLAGIEARSELVRHLSGERIAAELEKLLAAPSPSVGLRPLESTGLLRWISPELAAQRGIPQNKVPGEDLWDHTVRSVDAAPADRPIIRLAALLHDIGKPSTFADGRFITHETVGVELAGELLLRLRFPRSTVDRVALLVRQHMFAYESSWGDAAIRRFIAKIGRPALDELFELRRADNIGSGLEPDAGGLDELRARVAEQLAAAVALDRGDLAVDGDDLIAELGAVPGPRLGSVLDHLLEVVVEDPALNDRPTLLLLAQAELAEDA